MEKLIIDGFTFTSSRDAKMAVKEKNAIDKIKDSIDIKNTQSVLDTYNKLVAKNYFTTPVGITFLYEMRDYLKQFYNQEELAPITIVNTKPKSEENIKYELNYKQMEKLKTENAALVSLKKKLVLAVVAMSIIIIGMVFIVITNQNLGYFNAEEKVLNKYASWQERLENWEEELIRREDELGK